MKRRCLFFVAAALFGLLAACGGGGGGGGGEAGGGGGGGGGGAAPPPAASLNYIGSLDQAPITQDNCQELAVMAYSGGGGGLGGPALDLLRDYPDAPVGLPRHLTLIQRTEEIINGLHGNRQFQADSMADLVTETMSISGNCGGSAKGSLTYDTVKGTFSAEVLCNSYCSNGVVINGPITFTGYFNTKTGYITSCTATLQMTSISLAGYSFTYLGSVYYVYGSEYLTVTEDILYRDNTTGLVYWTPDFTIVIRLGSNYFDFSVSGTIYDPLFGYVVMASPVMWRCFYSDYYPSQGQFVISGAGGATARLIFLSPYTFEVELDEDGDGSFEWTTGVLYW